MRLPKDPAAIYVFAVASGFATAAALRWAAYTVTGKGIFGAALFTGCFALMIYPVVMCWRAPTATGTAKPRPNPTGEEGRLRLLSSLFEVGWTVAALVYLLCCAFSVVRDGAVPAGCKVAVVLTLNFFCVFWEQHQQDRRAAEGVAV
jgi:hypothetical protein